jgi:CTP:molybdopterin cytidylyltransferase MocA
MFRAPVWPELATCAGAPDGARSVVRSEEGRVIRFAVDDPGVVVDVDVPEALG